jgi:hypothetical protein
MAEIKTIEDVKKEIGNKVKFGKSDNVSDNLKELDVLEGTITKVNSSWEHTIKDGDKCTSWTANVDVVDPKDSGIHHLATSRIFSLDHKDQEIKDIDILDKIVKLQDEILKLESELELKE